MKQSDASRTGRSNGIGADLGTVAWKWRTSGRVPNVAIDRFGKIFLGATFNDQVWSGDNYVTVLYGDGSVFWRQKVPSTWGYAQTKSAPALDTATNAVYNNPDALITRFSEGGDVTLQIAGNPIAPNDSAPAVMGDSSIYHHQFLKLRKYSATGQVIFERGVNSLTDVAVNPSNGESVMGGIRSSEPHGSTDLTYINSDGTIRWVRTSISGVQANPTIGPDGTVYCNMHDTFAISPQNVTLWRQPNAGFYNPVSLTLDGDVLRWIGVGTIQRLNRTNGAIMWSTSIAGAPAGSLAVDGRGFIYATTLNGYAVKLDPNSGAVLFSQQICTAFSTGPAISSDRSIVAVGKEEFTNFVYKVK